MLDRGVLRHSLAYLYLGANVAPSHYDGCLTHLSSFVFIYGDYDDVALTIIGHNDMIPAAIKKVVCIEIHTTITNRYASTVRVLKDSRALRI